MGAASASRIQRTKGSGMLDIKIFNSFTFGSLAFFEYGMAGLVKTVLDAPLNVRSGGRMVYEDKFSGAEMEVTSRGGRVDKVSISLEFPEWAGGSGRVEKVIEFDFDRKAPRIKAVEREFKKLHENGDESALRFFDRASNIEDLTDGATDFFGSWSTGSSQNDVFRLRGGNDYATATAGNDRYDGGTGYDLLDYSRFDFFDQSGMRVTTSKGGWKVVKSGGLGTDTVKNVEGLTLTSGDDKVKSRLKSDTRVDAGFGDDDVKTGNGDDILIGGDGADVLRAGGGRDILIAGSGFGQGFGQPGQDQLFGQGGSDLFVIERTQSFGALEPGVVVIEDFKNGTDFIGLSGLKFNDVSFEKAGRDVNIIDQGEVLAVVKNVRPNALDREDFYSDLEPGVFLDFF